MNSQEVGLAPTPISGFSKALAHLPGLGLLFIVGYAGKVIARYVPHTEYVLFAIAIGMVLRNTIAIPKLFLAGANTYEFLLKTGIVLMGARLALQSVISIGTRGVLLVVAEITLALTLAQWMGRRLGLSEKLSTLIGVGLGICGVSAIIGATGAIEAKEEDASYAIATVLGFGAFMLFALPMLGRFLGASDTLFGFWTGLSMDNTAECVATGFAFSEEAGKIATIVKMARNAMMGFVVLIIALAYARKGMTSQVTNKAQFLWSRFPKFLIGFLILSLLSTMGFFTSTQLKAIDNLTKWIFMMTFAGVGLATDFSKMKSGIRPFLVGLAVDISITVITLVMVVLAIPGGIT